MLEIGIQSRGIIRESVIEEGYKKIKQAGMNCVDYNIMTSKEHTEKLEVAYFGRHKECADKYGLHFSQVHAPLFKYDTDKPDRNVYILEEMKKSIAICRLLDSRYLVMHPFELAFNLGKAEERKINLEFFSALAEEAISENVMICIENMPSRKNERLWEGACSSARETVDYINTLNERAGKECFGACFDVGHANVLGKNLREEVKTLGEHLKVLHIHDNDGVTDSHQLPHTFSNRGNSITDWAGFLLGLRDIGFGGVLSFETYGCFFGIPGVLQEPVLSFLYSVGTNFSRIICFEEILEQMGAKKRILFGSGKMFDVYMRDFGSKYPPFFVVDNNAALWGTDKLGIPIRSPRDILGIPEEGREIILCNAYYEDNIKQLHDMGIDQCVLTEEILRMTGRPL